MTATPPSWDPDAWATFEERFDAGLLRIEDEDGPIVVIREDGSEVLLDGQGLPPGQEN